jgi:hypothetical protein
MNYKNIEQTLNELIAETDIKILPPEPLEIWCNICGKYGENIVNWKSFKQEKPLIGQRILIYDNDTDSVTPPYEVVKMMADNKLQRLYGFYESFNVMDWYYWCSVPNITEDMK